jgi:hypothetical protein
MHVCVFEYTHTHIHIPHIQGKLVYLSVCVYMCAYMYVYIILLSTHTLTHTHIPHIQGQPDMFQLVYIKV